MDTLLQDIRFGWRLLRRSPGFTIAAVLALALGIGATTAVFTLLDRVVLRPLPYPDPDRLTMVWETNDTKGLSHERLSPVNFMDHRALPPVVGVMPPGFQYPNDTDVWHRLQWDLTQHSRGAHFMESIVRLKPGVTIVAANAELRALTSRLGKENPSTNGEWRARATPLSEEVVGFFRPALFALFGAAAFLLVITCTNVASLLLARATVREREVAVRAAIGASRTRLVRQFLTESILLAVMGTTLGVVLAVASVRALVAASPVGLPRVDGIGVDARLLMFAVTVAAITPMAFGVVPALLMARGDMQRPLKESGRGGDGSGTRRRARSVLVVAEIGLAVMLLVGATLLARSFQRLVH